MKIRRKTKILPLENINDVNKIFKILCTKTLKHDKPKVKLSLIQIMIMLNLCANLSMILALDVHSRDNYVCIRTLNSTSKLTPISSVQWF